MEGAEGKETVLSELELAIETVAKNYNVYSKEEFPFVEKKQKIRKSKFKEILQSDLKHMLRETEDKEEVKRLMNDLDQNGDQEIDFKEYWDLIRVIVMPVTHITQCQLGKKDGR